jgi:ATP-dependent protease HslVU (ClpYQ) ATPase subunit
MMFGGGNGLPKRAKLDRRIADLEQEFNAVQAAQREFGRRYANAQSLSPRTSEAVALMKESREQELQAQAQRNELTQVLNRLYPLRRQLDELVVLREETAKALPNGGMTEAELRGKLADMVVQKQLTDDVVKAAVRAHEGARASGVSQDLAKLYGSVVQRVAQRRDATWKEYAETLDAVLAVERYHEVERELPERIQRLTEQMKERGVL